MEHKKVAVIGSGVAGLAAAWELSNVHDITLYEADDRLGGHANTVELPDGTSIDCGFIVYNEKTYPNLCALFETEEVATEASDMSFGLSIRSGKNSSPLEYAGDNLNTLFAQRRNLVSPRFLGLIKELLRFYRHAPKWLALNGESSLTLGEFLKEFRYGNAFIKDHLIPMGAAIWSTPDRDMLQFPATTFIQFCVNHGLLQVKDRPQWRTVTGGSHRYVQTLAKKFKSQTYLSTPVQSLTRDSGHVVVKSSRGEEKYHEVVVATHADQALKLLTDPSKLESEILEPFKFSHSKAYLHTDPTLMPKNRRVWSSWNYIADRSEQDSTVSVTYWMNRLQNISGKTNYFVSLNPLTPPDPSTIIKAFDYTHPLFSQEAIAAQKRLKTIQGANNCYYCGAWTGYGFHEDGLSSGLAVAEHLGAKRPWYVEEASPAGKNTIGN